MKKAGVLSLQGDFAAHGAALSRAGAQPVFVREPEQFQEIDGLIIPGGESTTMLKLLDLMHLKEAFIEFGKTKPVFGTCAGAILMASKVSHPDQECFSMMDIAVERNAYGRQIDSRVAAIIPELEFRRRSGADRMEAIFIRAPIIRSTGPEVKVLARYHGDPVLAEQGRHLVSTFHPELTNDKRIHELFLNKL
jgi:5'-phosphate synthase pdxT subunit